MKKKTVPGLQCHNNSKSLVSFLSLKVTSVALMRVFLLIAKKRIAASVFLIVFSLDNIILSLNVQVILILFISSSFSF